MINPELDPWLESRKKLRTKITDQKLSNLEILEALQAHDLALLALIEAQASLPAKIEEFEGLTPKEDDWLSTFALIFQSLDVPRGLILGACYTLVAAALKQEWDGIYMLASLSKGKAKFGGSPNIQNVLGKTPHLEHRLLQPIAHLTGKGLGRAFAVRSNKDADHYWPAPMPDVYVASRLLRSRCYLLGHLFLQLKSFLHPIEIREPEAMLSAAMNYIDRYWSREKPGSNEQAG